jgi:O-antigen/teichoic acid export membrane protein
MWQNNHPYKFLSVCLIHNPCPAFHCREVLFNLYDKIAGHYERIFSQANPLIKSNDEVQTVSTPPSPLIDLFKQLANLSRDVILYGVGGTFNQLMGVVTVPILTRVFSVEEFGTIDLLNYFVTLVFYIGGLGLSAGMLRLYYDLSDDDIEGQKHLVSTIVNFVMVTNIPFFIIISLFSDVISQYLFGSPTRSPILQICTLSLITQLPWSLFVSIQRIRRKPTSYLMLNIGYSLVNFAVLLILVVAMRVGLIGYYWAALIAYGVMTAIGFWMTRGYITLYFSKKIFLDVAVLGIAQLPAILLSWLQQASNRYFLNAYTNTTQVGFYSLVSRVSLILALIYYAFVLAWDPYMLSILKRPNVQEIFRSVLKYYTLLILGLGGILCIFVREIFLIFAPPAYLVSAPVLAIFILRHLFLGMMGITNIGVTIAKKPVYISIAYAVSASVTLLSNVLLTRSLGIYGAALSEMLGFLVCFIIMLIYSVRLYPINWNLPVVAKMILGFLVTAGISILLLRSPIQPGMAFMLKIPLLAAYAFFLLQFIEPDQRSLLFRKAPVVVWNWTQKQIKQQLKKK